ncbi:MAG: aspartate-semialdehyde dehydrogenase [Desulfovibrionaceae bacterium]|nr:aspartate-semialdehyde dehydrogenase [Desulfovibrionaceae bacterium]
MDSHIAVFGAETALGREIVNIAAEKGIDRAHMHALCDDAALGDTVPYGTSDITLRRYDDTEETRGLLANCHVAFFCLPEASAKRFVPLAIQADCLAIDTSRAYRLDPRARLLGPDRTGEAIILHEGLIALPGSTAMALATALLPLHEEAGITRLLVTSLESVSGAGLVGVQALEKEIGDLFSMGETESYTFKRQIAFNVLPETSNFTTNDATRDEEDLAKEVPLLLEDTKIALHATRVRVPVFYCHSIAVSLTTKKALSAKNCRAILAQHPDTLRVVDNPRENIYPTPLDVGGTDKVHVGRIRQDTTAENTLSLWIVFDNLYGKAYAAVDCALKLIARNRLGTNPTLLME